MQSRERKVKLVETPKFGSRYWVVLYQDKVVYYEEVQR